MLVKELANTGVQIPEIGIGTFDYRGTSRALREGLDQGALFIDTAESYGTESVVSEAIRGIRNRVFLATKVSPEHFRPTDFRASVDASLKRLYVDSVDLLQLHHPNPEIPIEETAGALAQLIDEGKVRFCGVSNFNVEQLEAAQDALGKHPIVSNQVRYNLIDRSIESGLLQYCQTRKITVIAYSPLAKSLSRITDCDPTGAIAQIAAETGKTPAQIIINWCLCKEGVVAIPKGGSAAHIVENCGASDWRLKAEQIRMLDARVQYRHRTWFDQFVRKKIPRPIQDIAKQAARYLPRSIRRRLL